MENRILEEKIDDVIKLLEGFKGLDPRVDGGINSFQEIKLCLSNPTPQHVDIIRELLKGLNKEIGPYRSYVPEIAAVLDGLKDCLNKIN